MAMTIIEELAEPLINGELHPPIPSTSPCFPVTENHIASTKPLTNGHGNNPVSHDPEEKGLFRWVWGEVREQLWLAGPIVGTYLMQHIMLLAVTVFVGHLGSLPLAAFTLATAFTNMTGFNVLIGMAAALETLCGQAFGAKQYHLLGIFLQRAIFILTLSCIPISLIWLNMGKILVALGQDPIVTQIAQSYTYWLLPAFFAFAIFFPLMKFFQTQCAVVPLLLASAVSTLLCHVPLCWLVIDKLRVGVNGAAIVYACSVSVNVSLLLLFVRFEKRFKKTFTGVSLREALRDFGDFFGLAVPSATMICMEAWSHEILTMLAGLLPNSELNISSFAICMSLLASSNMIALALGIATSVRVANELGAGEARAARSAFVVSVVAGLVHGTVMATFIYLFRQTWGWVFTNDYELVQHVAHTAPYLAVLAVLYALGTIFSGAVRGIGCQRAGAMANLGAYYAFGIPVAAISVFIFKFDARGLWLGMGCGLVTQIVGHIYIILRPNWDQLAQEALLRSRSYGSLLPTLIAPLLKTPQEDEHSSEDPQKVLIET